MTRESGCYKITVVAPSRRELLSQLDRAVQERIAKAAREGNRSRGLVVTRHDYERFTVERTDEVPFGITVERDQVRQWGK